MEIKGPVPLEVEASIVQSFYEAYLKKSPPYLVNLVMYNQSACLKFWQPEFVAALATYNTLLEMRLIQEEKNVVTKKESGIREFHALVRYQHSMLLNDKYTGLEPKTLKSLLGTLEVLLYFLNTWGNDFENFFS